MHTGALYLTSEHHQPVGACGLLHTYSIAIFLATFFLTLVSIIVSLRTGHNVTRHVTCHRRTVCKYNRSVSSPAPGARG